MSDNARFPIQQERGATRDGQSKLHRGFTIPWSVAQAAYETYARLYPGSAQQQSLEVLAARGGFGQRELLFLLSGGEDDTLL